jgi:exonuclease SbcD
MKLLHTSDWHLGKRLFKLDRAPEHELFLNWLLSTLREESIDVLLITGDIFDVPNPPHQSLELFYHFLHRVSTETRARTLIISGNHDSGVLLEAPAKLLESHRVKVWGKLSENPEDHWCHLDGIDFCAIPFFRSYELLPTGEGDALLALKAYLEKKRSGPQVLLLHHLAGLYEAAGSEQVIALSGVDSIPYELLEGFDYVALGHIHKPQKIGKKSFYSGSPIPLRFSETLTKSVVLIDDFTIKTLPIPSFRNLFAIKTNEDKLKKDLEKLVQTSPLAPVVEVQLELKSPRTGLVDEIKNLLDQKGMELLSFLPIYERGETKERKSEKLFELSPLELFQEFYTTKYPEAEGLPEDLKEDFLGLLAKVKDAAP